MNIIDYATHDMRKHFYQLLCDMLTHLEAEEVLEEDFWDQLKQYNEVPNFTNVWINMTCQVIKQSLQEIYGVQIEYAANCTASYLVINGQNINSLDDFYSALPDLYFVRVDDEVVFRSTDLEAARQQEKQFLDNGNSNVYIVDQEHTVVDENYEPIKE